MKHPIVFIGSLSMIFFISCNSNSHSNFSNEEKLQYTKMGNSVVKQTFDTLSHSLQKAIAEKGVEKAVSFCQVNAYPLTDTYASDSVTIRRTALKYRNPANKPTAVEERILKFFASQKEKGITNDSLKAITEKGANGVVHFYKPIILQQMCATCHGNKTDIAQATLWKNIDSLYPSDMAYNFKPGDLRGLWHVSFIKKQNRK